MDRPWGKWTRLYQDEQVELRKLKVVEGGYCTLHYHEHQSNQFAVVQGRLVLRLYHQPEAVEVDIKLAAEVDTIIDITPGTSSGLVLPGRIHCFHAHTPVVAYELIVATGDNPLDPNDSVKLGEAGIGEPEP